MSLATQEKKVFLVEDNLEVGRMYERAFRLHGYQMDIVHDGETALAKITAESTLPDVIILDAVLPHMNGSQLLEHLRANTRFARVPIVILTNSLVSREDEKRFAELGADLYLVKIENQPKQVVEKIEDLMHRGVLHA